MHWSPQQKVRTDRPGANRSEARLKGQRSILRAWFRGEFQPGVEDRIIFLNYNLAQAEF